MSGYANARADVQPASTTFMGKINMSCGRCSGFLVVDRYVEVHGNLHYLRCINCGSVRDARIDVHRIRPVTYRNPRPPKVIAALALVWITSQLGPLFHNEPESRPFRTPPLLSYLSIGTSHLQD